MGNQPIMKFKAGAIEATIWENEMEKEGRKFLQYSISILRNFQDKEQKWRSTSSYNANDLPKVTLVSQKAYEWAMLKSGVDKPKPQESSQQYTVETIR